MKYLMPSLTVLFIYLKLTHVIDWSWWFVLSPVWGGVVLSFIFVFVALVFVSLFGSPRQKTALKITVK